MAENIREKRVEAHERRREAGVCEASEEAAAPAAALPEDRLFEDPFDRPRESAR